ncbi:hypothetical protein BDR07DRAFT_1399939, partial [Suillus spraguei]
MYTAILLSSPLTMLIPYGGAMMIRPSPPPTDGQTYIRLVGQVQDAQQSHVYYSQSSTLNEEEQRGILQQRFPRAGYWFN